MSLRKAQLIQDGARHLPPLEPGTKFYISFDGTGVPVRKAEWVGRPGKQPDGSARTREAKLGCVFTQVGLDEQGHPQRDPDSTTYVGAIESSTLFGWRMYAEAVRRGLEQATAVIALTDGQRYNHTIVQTHFSQAVHIVDLFHAYEHLTTIAQLLGGQEAKAPKAWRESVSDFEFSAGAEPVERTAELELWASEPGRGLAGDFASAAVRHRRTVTRSTPSSRAVLRLGQPRSYRATIVCC